jgi:cell division protein FtsI/penicillin-binding protein 2
MIGSRSRNARIWSLAASAAFALSAPALAAPRVRVETLVHRDHRYVAELEGGGLAELTINPALQQAAMELLASHDVPYGAAVVLSIADGRVLALAGRSAVEPTLGAAELALRPWAPAASVFKVVAASALVGEANLSATTEVCYHGGISAVLPENLLDLPKLDRRCDTLAYAIGKSQNAMVAKLVARHLQPAQLARTAAAFGFGAAIPFDADVEPSEVEIPSEPLEFARTAAGFWHSSLSPLHGALLAAAVANDGQMPAPRLIERAFGPVGRALPVPRRPARRVLDPRVAREVGRMMALTTTIGTAKHAFRDRRGKPYLPVDVAGKTGTLFYRGRAEDPALPAAVLPAGGLGYSWFVGYAPVDHPRIAFAVAIGNRSAMRIKASFVARRMVAEYLATAPADVRPAKMLAAR